MELVIRCPDCYSLNVKSLEMISSVTCGAYLNTMECEDCDAAFLMWRDFSGKLNVNTKLNEFREDPQLKELNDYLLQMANSTEEWSNHYSHKEAKQYLVRSISSRKVLAKLKLFTSDSDFNQTIGKQATFLERTNPVLFELEVLLDEVIPRVEKVSTDSFGFEANNHSILGLNISNRKLIYIPSRIFLFPNLRRLYLHNNNIKSIPKEISQTRRLELLFLHSNNLKRLPDGITNLTDLKQLSLDAKVDLTGDQQNWIDNLEKQNNCEVLIS